MLLLIDLQGVESVSPLVRCYFTTPVPLALSFKQYGDATSSQTNITHTNIRCRNYQASKKEVYQLKKGHDTTWWLQGISVCHTYLCLSQGSLSVSGTSDCLRDLWLSQGSLSVSGISVCLRDLWLSQGPLTVSGIGEDLFRKKAFLDFSWICQDITIQICDSIFTETDQSMKPVHRTSYTLYRRWVPNPMSYHVLPIK